MIKYKYFKSKSSSSNLNKSDKEAPNTPANPDPELQPETQSWGKVRMYPKNVASPKDCPVPIITAGIKVKKNANFWLKLSLLSIIVKIVNKKRYPKQKYIDNPNALLK